MNAYPFSQPKHSPASKKNNISLQLSTYYGKLLKMQSALAIVDSIFDDKQVWADQCEYAINIMGDIQESADALIGIFKSIKPLPDEIRNLRYPILAGGNNIISQIDDFIYFVGQINNNNRQALGNQKNRREIQALLRKIDSNIEILAKNLGGISGGIPAL